MLYWKGLKNRIILFVRIKYVYYLWKQLPPPTLTVFPVSHLSYNPAPFGKLHVSEFPPSLYSYDPAYLYSILVHTLIF